MLLYNVQYLKARVINLDRLLTNISTKVSAVEKSIPYLAAKYSIKSNLFILIICCAPGILVHPCAR